MSFALAGAAKGLGLGLMKVADDAKKAAQAKIDRRDREDEYRRRLEIKEEFEGGGRRGSGGGSGSGGGRGLSNSDEVRIEKAYSSLYGDADPGDETVPTLPVFKSEVSRLMSEGMTRTDAELKASESWQGREETVIEQVPRSALNPRSWGGGTANDTYPEERTVTKFGFGGGTPPAQGDGLRAAIGGDEAPQGAGLPQGGASEKPPAPEPGKWGGGYGGAAPSKGPEYPPAPRRRQNRVVGQLYTAPKDKTKTVRWTGEGWEEVNG